MGVYVKTILSVSLVTVLDALLRQTDWWRMPEGPLEIFFSVFGVVYAIIVGFAMYEALNNYSQIRHHMNSEVNELQDLRDYLMYVDGHEDVTARIAVGLRDYAASVVEQEWPEMSREHPLDMDTPDQLYRIMADVKAISPGGEREVLAVERSINTLAQITTHRTNRITASVERLPGLLVQLLAILSLFMIVAFTLISIESSGLKTLLTAANSFGVAFTFFVILDLDYPFHGVWSLRPEPFEEFVKRCERRSSDGNSPARPAQ